MIIFWSWILISFHIWILIVGLINISASTGLYLTIKYTYPIIGTPFPWILVALTVLGVVQIIVGLVGIFGVVIERIRLLLHATAILHLIVIIAHIVILSQTRNVDLKATISTKFNSYVVAYDQEVPIMKFQKIVDKVQSELHCCGGQGSQQWDKIIPETCCIRGGEKCVPDISNPKNIYRDGCNEKILDYIVSKIAVVTGLMAFELVVIILLGVAFFALAIYLKVKFPWYLPENYPKKKTKKDEMQKRPNKSLSTTEKNMTDPEAKRKQIMDISISLANPKPIRSVPEK